MWYNKNRKNLGGKNMKNIWSKVDLTMLKRTTSSKDIMNLCEKAKILKTASVCVPSYYVSQAKFYLEDSDIKVCTVVGFPNGNCSTATKVAETIQALNDGALEIDMVINIGEAVAENWQYVADDIKAVVEAIDMHKRGCDIVTLKVIVETCCLNEWQIKKMCQICAECGADYIKTSTGFAEHGATIEAVSIMKETITKNNYDLKIKASGGIRTIEEAKKYIDFGTDRIGASNLQ